MKDSSPGAFDETHYLIFARLPLGGMAFQIVGSIVGGVGQLASICERRGKSQ